LERPTTSNHKEQSGHYADCPSRKNATHISPASRLSEIQLILADPDK
jgi:hypothetical protein